MKRTKTGAGPSRDGDTIEEWVAGSYSTAYRTAYLIVRNASDAEEAVQDAFLRVWRFRDSLPAGAQRDAWLYRVIVNSCHSLLRREIPRRERTIASGAEASSREPTPEQAAEQSETADAVASALGALPDHLRIPIILRYGTGLSEQEIATAIQRRPGTVKSRLHEARRRLAGDPNIATLEAQR